MNEKLNVLEKTVKESIAHIIDILNIKFILFGIWIVSVCGIIIPKNIVNYLGLLKIKQQYQTTISLVFIGISAYYIAVLLVLIFKKISEKLKIRKLNKYFTKSLRELTSDEKSVLLSFYDEDKKEFRLQTNLSIQNSAVNLLSTKMIISRGSQIGDLYTGFNFYIQPGAYKELNQMLRDGEIKAVGKGFEWD